MPVPSPLDRERRLAATYETSSWERVWDYQRVRDYQLANREASENDAASDLNLDPNYIHNWWYTDTKPAAVNATEVADDHGWVDAKPGDQVFEALHLARVAARGWFHR